MFVPHAQAQNMIKDAIRSFILKNYPRSQGISIAEYLAFEITDRLLLRDSSKLFGFSRPSFYQAQSAFEEDGLAGLVPHKRGPKQAHKLTEEILTFIGEVRQKQPSIRLPDLVKRIEEQFGTKVHPRSIERSLLRHQKKR